MIKAEATQKEKSKSVSPFVGKKHLLEPDFNLPSLEVPRELAGRMQGRIERLYGEEQASEVYHELVRVLNVHYAYMTPELREAEQKFNVKDRFTERDVILITYGDLIESKGKTPLKALAEFTERVFGGLITTLHILPFYPYSSDRGFAVMNYGEVDPKMGTWEDIIEIHNSFKLMFDGVINHCSSKCKWFRRYISGDKDYEDYFIAFDSEDGIDTESLSKILRPRTSSLLTRFPTIDGAKYVWTTFSEDQVDLNFKNPRVLIKIVRILLDYVRRGSDIIRLDAITYLWRELGTSCAHLEQTHEVVKLLRDVLDAVAPHLVLITETNVPHEDNITYFGSGTDEAQMVYNFALPPLVLHTFLNGNAQALTEWAKGLEPPTDTTAFFNFLDSHDGIGILGAKGYLSDDEIKGLCTAVEERGGFVSMKSDGQGGESPYELNITWFSALSSESNGESEKLQMGRFIASRAVALALKGVPGIYILSMFASRNDLAAVSRDGVKRSINRSTLYENKIIDMFLDRRSPERAIVDRFMKLLEVRVAEPAFHPNAAQEVLDYGPGVFALKRVSPDGGSAVLSLINVTSEKISLQVLLDEIGMKGPLHDLVLEHDVWVEDDTLPIVLEPYRVAWLRQEK